MSTLLRQTPRWLLVAGFAAAAAGVNVLLGMGAAVGERTLLLAVVVGMLPAALIAFGALVESQRALLAWAALGINLTGLRFFAQPLPLPGGANIYFVDLLLLLAVGAWLAARLSPDRRPAPVRLSVIFTWPLALFAIAMLMGALEGRERYGASLIGQPLRMVLYAGIALALTDTTPTSAWKAITRVFYAGAVIQAFSALYYLATGSQQTESQSLSTGGVRVLALSTAVYLTGSLICALLNLELERQPGRQLGHAAIAGLALFGVVVSFGRTSYAAIVLIVPLLLITRRYLRRTVLIVLPLFAPLLVLLALFTPKLAPDLLPAVERRVTGTSSEDINVVFRDRAREAVLEDVHGEWLTGVGFGRIVRFEIEGRVYTIFDDPHDSYVYLLAGGGIFALGSFLLICVLYVLDSLRRLRGADAVGQALIIWAVGTWLAFMVNAAAGPTFPNSMMMLTIWALFALPSVVPREQPAGRAR